MNLEAPVTTLNPDYSSAGAIALPWGDAELRLRDAGVFWLSSVRPEGRPHVAPVFGVWLDGAFYFSTGENELKARNLAENAQVSVTTGRNDRSNSLDIVIEGVAVMVHDEAKRSRLANTYAAKYGESWRLPDLDGVVVFEVTPTTAFGFGRGDAEGLPPEGGFNQTRWRFQAGQTSGRER